MAANEIQVGGKHYKATSEELNRAKAVGLSVAPEPWDFSFIRGHNNLQAGVLKYVDRYAKKNGLEDLHKAKHYLDKLIEVTCFEEQARQELESSKHLPVQSGE